MAKILAQVTNGAGKGDSLNTVSLPINLIVVTTGDTFGMTSVVDILGSAATLNTQIKTDVVTEVNRNQFFIDKGITTSNAEVRVLGGF